MKPATGPRTIPASGATGILIGKAPPPPCIGKIHGIVPATAMIAAQTATWEIGAPARRFLAWPEA